MRLIDAKLGEVRAIAVSPDSRFVAASGGKAFGAFYWATGEPVPLVRGRGLSEQIVFNPAGTWAARVASRALCLEEVTTPALLPPNPAPFAGGVAVSPDGKTLVAMSYTGGFALRWTLPALKPISRFEYWPPFSRLAFSPNGEFLAGIWNEGFELRFAVSGGLDYRHRMSHERLFAASGFVSFDRDSGTCAFGWAGEFHILDISTGTSRPLRRVSASFRDAAFVPSAHRFATVGDDGRLKLWDAQTWEVVREYDWGCGALTALAFTADGSAGVCGTADGRLVQFDVDE